MPPARRPSPSPPGQKLLSTFLKTRKDPQRTLGGLYATVLFTVLEKLVT